MVFFCFYSNNQSSLCDYVFSVLCDFCAFCSLCGSIVFILCFFVPLTVSPSVILFSSPPRLLHSHLLQFIVNPGGVYSVHRLQSLFCGSSHFHLHSGVTWLLVRNLQKFLVSACNLGLDLPPTQCRTQQFLRILHLVIKISIDELK